MKSRKKDYKIEKFAEQNVCVVGDLMLDRYIWGDVERISPEAPIPVLKVSKETFMPGGAGNTAINISTLGGKVYMVGCIGNDVAGRQILKLFKKYKIKIDEIVVDKTRPTTEKIRIVARGQQIVRVDKETTKIISKLIKNKIKKYLSSNIDKINSIVISDYQKGLLDDGLIKFIINLSNKHDIPVIGDIKLPLLDSYKNITIITPNLSEALQLAKKGGMKEAGFELRKKLNANILITRGSEGMTLFKKNSNQMKNFISSAHEVFDVSGAGDTVAATLALGLAAAISLEKVVSIANNAAGLVVGKLGTASITTDELIKSINDVRD